MARLKGSSGSGIVAVSSFSPFPGVSSRFALPVPEVAAISGEDSGVPDTSGEFGGICSDPETALADGGSEETGEER
jgi:hypothetical protein